MKRMTFSRLAIACMGIASVVMLAGVSLGAVRQARALSEKKALEAPPKKILGATAEVGELQSELVFAARVDTGATTCSVHVEKWEIPAESPEMTENVGKKIRFLVKNHEDSAVWVQSKIVEAVPIKTSEKEEVRYKVPMTLVCEGVQKRVLVSLNDRSHMTFPMLVGRNFLEEDFLVDVSKE